MSVSLLKRLPLGNGIQELFLTLHVFFFKLTKYNERVIHRDFPGGPVAKEIYLPGQEVGVRPLIRELRSHMPYGQKNPKYQTEAMS